MKARNTRCPPAQIIPRLFVSGRAGTSTPSPPPRRWRLLVALSFRALAFFFHLISLGRSSCPINATDDGVVSSAGNQGCDKQTLYPRAALLLNYKIPTLHWRRSTRGWCWVISQERAPFPNGKNERAKLDGIWLTRSRKSWPHRASLRTCEARVQGDTEIFLWKLLVHLYSALPPPPNIPGKSPTLRIRDSKLPSCSLF